MKLKFGKIFEFHICMFPGDLLENWS